MTPQPVLCIRGLCHAYEGRLLFKNLNIDFFPSTITLITGSNGSGKTTFLKIAAGLVKPDRGGAIHSPHNPPAYLGHDAMFYPGLTALENLAFWLKFGQSRQSQAKLAETLSSAGLGKYGHTPVGKFSQGMLQKLQIARLLLQEAILILLDEPSSGLDRQSRVFLREKALELRDKGACIVMVSHDAERDAAISDRVLKLEGHSLLPWDSGGDIQK